MKTEKFLFQDKNGIFENVPDMHDCTAVASFENGALTLTFDGLKQYSDPYDHKPWFGEYTKLTIICHGTERLCLELYFGKKEKLYSDTLAPLEGRELIMFNYAIDTFETMILNFHVMFKKRLWGGKIEICFKEIECIWK